MTVAVIVLTNDYQIQYMNQSAEILFGQSLQRMRGNLLQVMISGDEFYDQLAAICQQQEPHAIRAATLTVNDGETLTMDCIATPQFSMPDDDQHYLLLELQRIDRQLQIVREKQFLQQQQAIHELVRGLAHEIKNPLGGLRGAAQLLESELNNPELLEYTQIIISEADRLKNLVDELLGPGKPPKHELINIHEILEHVCSIVTVGKEQQIKIFRNYDPSIPEFVADRDHLIQICLNIANNAVRAIDQQGRIEFRTRILRQFTINQIRHKLVLKLDICDDGMGVPQHLLDKIFLPMVSGHADGSGLGLSIAQTLLNHQGGMIQCDSSPGATCFSIYIPLRLGA